MRERGANATRAVGVPTLGVDRSYLLAQPGIGKGTVARRSSLPDMKARTRNAEHAAEKRDRMVGPLRRDEAKALHRVSLSFAKKAAAFSRISRSWRRVRDLAAKLPKLRALVGGEAGLFASVDLRLLDPEPKRLVRDAEAHGRFPCPAYRSSGRAPTASRRNSDGYGARYGT